MTHFTNKNHWWIIALILALLTVTTSCGKRQHILVSQALVSLPSSGGIACLKIEADCEWTIEQYGNEDWFTFSPSSGGNNAIVTITASPNTTSDFRDAYITVISSDLKTRRDVEIVQNVFDINGLIGKVWFTRTYERWDTDYYNQIIEESYRDWVYYVDWDYVNWYFFFMEDGTGYEIRAYQGDTLYYPYQFSYYPERDSLFISFETTMDTVESYNAIVHELNQERFTFSNEYRPHQFEMIYTVNVTGTRNQLKLNPKKVARKPDGPLIQVK